ncbi:hypothetical protein SAMN04487936_106211 [Halobacillus dabanensis]|uniref:Uncharacterized protein n=1 Tax=Halobacillus dabanensis TaxID=240302 RepID=A0A1I3W8K7_HALDA|nr:hypothetical protein [Halobacillus dabanensis]SFK03007.1 hypothetical protein SAMN04487936_106211 [Halobacillus dabanensis]
MKKNTRHGNGYAHNPKHSYDETGANTAKTDCKSNKNKHIIKDEVKTTKGHDFDILPKNSPTKESNVQPYHQITNKQICTVPTSTHNEEKDGSARTILNKYFTLGDKIHVYGGSRLLDQKGTFLTAGPDYFLWVDGDGYVRLQVLSGGISIGKRGKKN